MSILSAKADAGRLHGLLNQIMANIDVADKETTIRNLGDILHGLKGIQDNIPDDEIREFVMDSTREYADEVGKLIFHAFNEYEDEVDRDGLEAEIDRAYEEAIESASCNEIIGYYNAGIALALNPHLADEYTQDFSDLGVEARASITAQQASIAAIDAAHSQIMDKYKEIIDFENEDEWSEFCLWAIAYLRNDYFSKSEIKRYESKTGNTFAKGYINPHFLDEAHDLVD